MTIHVLLVDDHAILRAGLRRVLDAEDDIEVVAEAESAERALFEALSAKPDVAVLDVVMPGKSGIEATPELLKAVPSMKILVLSMQDDPRYVRAAFEAGASGYVLKEAADTDVVSAIREVARGGRYVHPELGARLVAAETEERKRAEEDPLSEREREVLVASQGGASIAEIAKTLFLSEGTVRNYLSSAIQKLEVSNRTEAARVAEEQGWL